MSSSKFSQTSTMSNSPLSPGSLPRNSTHPKKEEEDYEMVDADDEDEQDAEMPSSQGSTAQDTRAPREGRKEKDLNAFLNSMDKYAPIIPDAVTDYYLSLAGFECSDQRVKRLLALCTQKFISDLATDAYQFSKIRSSSSTSAAVPQMGARVGRPGKDKGRSVLTLEDLSAALGDGGVNVKRPEFYR